MGPEPWMTTVSPQWKPPARIARLNARLQAVNGSLSGGALLGQTLRGYSPAFAKARRVTIGIPGGGGKVTLPAAGTADLRGALPVEKLTVSYSGFKPG